MSKRDYYESLEVARDADQAEIKAAFRKKAMQHHPDRNPGDTVAEQTFKEANEAYEVLKDEQKRAAYDRFGHAAFDQAGGPGGFGEGGAQGFEFNFGSGFADIFEEMFSDFTGRGRQERAGAGRGNDLRYNLEISLEDAFKGKKTNIRIPTSVVCDECSGTGAEGGSKPESCPTCQGSGRVRAQQGFFTVERTCPNCHGSGETIGNPCKTCRGGGRVRKERALAVTIPAGVDDGNRIRLAGEGEAGVRGSPPGDLYIFVSVAPHEIFQRDGPNIYCQVPLPLVTAALGGSVEVPTVEGGRAKVSIPVGAQTGDQFRLRGKGMSVLRTKNRGDMLIEIMVETPQNLSKQQKELLEQFRAAGGDKTSPRSQGFFSRAKGMWEDMTD